MTIELKMLAWSIVLGLIHIILTASAGSKQNGLRWNISPRDEARPLQGMAGRLERAQRNFMETFPFFAAAVLIAHSLGLHSNATEWGAQLYFRARAAYLPLYMGGVLVLRSLAWAAATAGIVMFLVTLLS